MSTTDIPIGIEIKISDDTYNETISRLNQLSQLLNQITSQIPGMARSFSGMSDEVKNSSTQMASGLAVNGQVLDTEKLQFEKLFKTVTTGDEVFKGLLMVLDSVRSKKMSVSDATELFRNELGRTDSTTKILIGSQKQLSEMASKLGVSEQDLTATLVSGEIAASRQRVGMDLVRKQMLGQNLEIEKVKAGTGDLRIEEAKLNAELLPQSNAIKQVKVDSAELRVEEAKLNAELLPQKNVLKEVQIGVGITGTAYKSLARSLFWTGLGMMFTMMSFSRLERAQRQVETSLYSLKRAYVSLAETQADTKETIAEYGKRSREGIDASLALEEAQWRVAQAEYAITSSMEQATNATIEWVVGAAASSINAGFSIASSLFLVSAAQAGKTAATANDIPVEVADASVMGAKIPIINGLEVSYLKLAAAMAAVTFGLSLAIALISKAWAEQQAAESIRKTKEEVESLTESLSNLPLRSHSPLEIRTKQGWVPFHEIGEAGSISGIGSTIKSGNTTNINVSGPFYVREDADIMKIANAIKRKQISNIQGRTGGRI